MVIESRYWREDIARYIRAFRPKKKVPRWSEKQVVNFEKDVTLALFMVRRLAEAGKFSSEMKNHRTQVFRCAFHSKPHRLIHKDIAELYRLENVETVSKDVAFICNQFIHANVTFAYRGEDRNWEGLYTNSDYEKRKFIYKVPLSEIIKILELAVIDYPHTVSFRYDSDKQDWIVTTN